MSGGATVGSGRAYRLDPHTLPARSSRTRGGAAPVAFIIERDHTVVSGSLAAGPTVTVPIDAYRGVAIRMEAVGNNGDVCAFVELLHPDPELTLPLAITNDPYEIAGDWQEWGRTLGLPLLIVGQDGSIGQPLANIDAVHVGLPKPRRRHSYFAGRRPRFLTRRKIGHLDRVTVLSGREIIARN